MKKLLSDLLLLVFRPKPNPTHFNCPFCSGDIKSLEGEDAYCPSCNITFMTNVRYTNTLPPKAVTELRGDFIYGAQNEESLNEQDV